jgi:hypothetical protein
MMNNDKELKPVPVTVDPRSVSYKGEQLNVPDAFWDADSQSPNVGALVKSHADLRRKLSERGSDGVGAVMQVPEAYELVVPEDLAELIAADHEDPLAQNAMDWARRHGLGQDAFSELAAMYYGKLASGHKDASSQRDGELERLHESLGPRADRDMEDLSRWVDGVLGDDLVNAPELYFALDHLTSTADGVILLKTLKDRLAERGVPTARGGSGSHLNEAALRKMQGSEDYRSGDPQTRRKVAEGWARLYPDRER